MTSSLAFHQHVIRQTSLIPQDALFIEGGGHAYTGWVRAFYSPPEEHFVLIITADEFHIPDAIMVKI